MTKLPSGNGSGTLGLVKKGVLHGLAAQNRPFMGGRANFSTSPWPPHPPEADPAAEAFILGRPVLRSDGMDPNRSGSQLVSWQWRWMWVGAQSQPK